MNPLDILLLVLVFAYAVSGYWQGFVTGAFATAGLLLGAVLGLWASPKLVGEAEGSIWVPLGALVLVLVSALFGQALLQFLGARIRDWITWQPARALDAIGGAVLSVAAVLVVAWVLAVAVSGARLPWVSSQVRDSVVLERVNTVMPQAAVRALDSFNDVVGGSVFPHYLEPFAAERIVRVGPPPPRVAADPQVRAAAASVLKIRGENECGRGVEGTGFLFQPDRVMTNAHVVAGVDAPRLAVGDDEVEARVVHYDPDLDVAVLAVSGLGRPHLAFDRTAGPGDAGAVLGYPQDGPYVVQGARIRAEQRLRSPDIYGEGTVLRDVYSLRSTVRPGNSGGPLVSLDGRVAGVVFAASVTHRDTGYALTAEQVSSAAARGVEATEAVGTGPCT